MRDIEPMDEYGSIVVADVDRAVDGLRGRYASADLYARYSDAAREAGHAPAHPVAFGQEMKRRGFISTKKTVGGPGRGNGRRGQGRQVAAWTL